MANQEIVKILRVQTEGSERTVKGLKDEISALKDALLNVEQGTEQYDDIVKQLRQDQEDLTRVMNAGKKDVEALEGSYNYLVNTMRDLKKEWRATTDEVKRNELGQQIDSINNQLKEMDASIGNYQRNVGNYADGFSEAMKRQQEATELTRAKLESISKVASGLASGYAGLQGAMALMGVENKKLQETFVKLQAAIALAQGIGGLKDLVEGMGMAKVAFQGAITGVKTFITSLRGIKLAIASTGIGLLVVAVGFLAEALLSMGDDAEEATDSLKGFNDEVQRGLNLLDVETLNNYNQALRNYLEEAKKAGKDAQKLAEAQKNFNNAVQKVNFNDLVRKEEEAKKAYEKIFNYWKNAEDLKNSKSGEHTKEKDDELYKQVLEAQKKYKEATKNRLEFEVNIQEEATNKIIGLAEKQADKQKELQEKQLEQQKKFLEERNNIINKIAEGYRTAEEQELYELEQTYKKEKELVKDSYEDSLMLLEQYEHNKFRIKIKYANEALMKKDDNNKEKLETEQTFAEQEVEVKSDAKETDSNTEIEAINIEIEKLTELEELRIRYHNMRLEQIDELMKNENLSSENRKELEKEKSTLIKNNAIAEKKYINEVAKLNKQKTDEEKRIKRLQISSSIDQTRNLLDATSKLFKENSKEQKAMATAVATIDALKSANAAYYAMAGIPVVGPALGVAAAASALISGYANVKAIWKTDESGSNSESVLNSTPETSTVGVGVTPTFNAENALPVDYTRNLLTNSETDSLNNPMKVYVLESDITLTQNKVAVAENNATF